ncbi:hypothetical protein BaRGS_00003783, partial [Batillaria attramentaria]
KSVSTSTESPSRPPTRRQATPGVNRVGGGTVLNRLHIKTCANFPDATMMKLCTATRNSTRPPCSAPYSGAGDNRPGDSNGQVTKSVTAGTLDGVASLGVEITIRRRLQHIREPQTMRDVAVRVYGIIVLLERDFDVTRLQRLQESPT